MDMSPAALPPRPAQYEDRDVSHPLWPLYRQHLNFCARQMIAASHFRDWLYQYEQKQKSDAAAQHPEYPAFLAWMRATKAGARKAPGGLGFPHNFHLWREGARW